MTAPSGYRSRVAFDLNLQSPLLAIASAALAGFAVGIVPIGVAEVLAVAIGAVIPGSLAVTMLVVFTASHVASKWIWYVLGSLAERVRQPVALCMIARTREFLARNPGYGPSTLAAGALLSIPPFHLPAIAAGIIRRPVSQFLVICFSGRLIRFGVLAVAPTLWRAWSQ
ncbi:MAG: hypothetical protein IT357_17950 [Gemmatimonadaceae bacterium]|nr:hypothetical protein [Gemmatimonadaceae bacterium]